MRAGAQRRGASRVFPPAFPLAVILLAVLLERTWPLELAWTIPPGVRTRLGLGIIAGAVAIFGVWPALLFSRSGQSLTPWSPSPRLETRGPFRVTRNPMYLQMVLLCLGFAVLQMSWWLFLLTPLCAWLLQRYAILPEEAYLERTFGDEYRAYKRRVRRWI